MLAFCLVALGGGIGASLRYSLSLLVARLPGFAPLVATFAVNILGCLLIGALMGWLSMRSDLANATALKLFFSTGCLGGFTTFSTFSLEAFSLIESGHVNRAFLYISLSILMGLLAVWIGLSLTRKVI